MEFSPNARSGLSRRGEGTVTTAFVIFFSFGDSDSIEFFGVVIHNAYPASNDGRIAGEGTSEGRGAVRVGVVSLGGEREQTPVRTEERRRPSVR